jgi:hypothetical protein
MVFRVFWPTLFKDERKGCAVPTEIAIKQQLKIPTAIRLNDIARRDDLDMVALLM